MEKQALKKIGESIRADLENSGITTPSNYCPENAMKSAYLELKETVDRKKRPALEVCTPASVYQAMMSMVVQGLNPAKKQCYFVVYGSKLQLVRSYMGSQMIAKMADKRINVIRSMVVMEGDVFDYSIKNGKREVVKHEQTLDNIDNTIKGAYAVAVDHDDNVIYSDIMSFHEIVTSWSQSRMWIFDKSGNIKKDSTHGKFTGEMCRRTVIERMCKHIINASDDEGLINHKSESSTIIDEVRDNENQEELIDFQEDKAGLIELKEPEPEDEKVIPAKKEERKQEDINKDEPDWF